MKIGIIGGGAAGIFAAINIKSKHPDYSVTVIEKSNKLLQKVKISGGGRCNVTHYCFDPKELVQNYPRGKKELLSVFHQFQPADTIEWFAKRGVTLKVEEDGRMFPETDNSQTIINCFLHEMEKLHIEVLFNTSVNNIIPENNRFILETNKQNYPFDAVIVATGGLNTSEKFSFLKNTGHTIIPPVPSLFTFKINNKNLHQLAGISVQNAVVSFPNLKLQQQGPLLITHQGISGPAVIKLSAFAARHLADRKYKETIRINWIDSSFDEVLHELGNFKLLNEGKKLKNTVLYDLPKRLWWFLLQESNINEELSWNNLSKKSMHRLAENLTAYNRQISGRSPFKEEFVTCGGVSRKEIDFRTMQSKLVPGLFFCGEVIDIDALTGGFNFLAAWSTARVISDNI